MAITERYITLHRAFHVLRLTIVCDAAARAIQAAFRSSRSRFRASTSPL